MINILKTTDLFNRVNCEFQLLLKKKKSHICVIKLPVVST